MKKIVALLAVLTASPGLAAPISGTAAFHFGYGEQVETDPGLGSVEGPFSYYGFDVSLGSGRAHPSDSGARQANAGRFYIPKDRP